MPKLPTMSEITSKVKSAVDSLMGPSTAQVTEESLANESDPTKAKLLEIEFLINQLHDVQLIQTKTINSLKTKYAALHKLIQTTLVTEKTAETSIESTDKTIPKPVEKQPINSAVSSPKKTTAENAIKSEVNPPHDNKDENKDTEYKK